ncbi:MAG: DUF6714 family protein [Pyrinomonadaceae bacterium]
MTSSEEEISGLKAKLMDVFQRTPPLSLNEITTSPDYYPQVPNLKRTFAEIEWWQISCETICGNYDKLPLFSDRAFYYVFPAYMWCALDELPICNLVCEFLIYELSPPPGKKVDARFVNCYSSRLAMFSTEEIDIIREFLRLLLSLETMKDFYSDIKSGLLMLDSNE